MFITKYVKQYNFLTSLNHVSNSGFWRLSIHHSSSFFLYYCHQLTENYQPSLHVLSMDYLHRNYWKIHTIAINTWFMSGIWHCMPSYLDNLFESNQLHGHMEWQINYQNISCNNWFNWINICHMVACAVCFSGHWGMRVIIALEICYNANCIIANANYYYY